MVAQHEVESLREQENASTVELTVIGQKNVQKRTEDEEEISEEDVIIATMIEIAEMTVAMIAEKTAEMTEEEMMISETDAMEDEILDDVMNDHVRIAEMTEDEISVIVATEIVPVLALMIAEALLTTIEIATIAAAVESIILLETQTMLTVSVKKDLVLFDETEVDVIGILLILTRGIPLEDFLLKQMIKSTTNSSHSEIIPLSLLFVVLLFCALWIFLFVPAKVKPDKFVVKICSFLYLNAFRLIV